MKIRIIKHEVIPDYGNYEVRFPDGLPSRYFYFENLPSRRLRPDLVEQAIAEQDAKAFARAEQAKLDWQYVTGLMQIKACCARSFMSLRTLRRKTADRSRTWALLLMAHPNPLVSPQFRSSKSCNGAARKDSETASRLFASK